MVKNAVIIDESELSVDSVSVGTHVTIQMTGEDETCLLYTSSAKAFYSPDHLTRFL